MQLDCVAACAGADSGSDSAESETSSETRATDPLYAPPTSPSTVTIYYHSDAIAAITIRKLRTPPQRRRDQELAVRQGTLALSPQRRRVRLRDVESLAIRIHVLHLELRRLHF